MEELNSQKLNIKYLSLYSLIKMIELIFKKKYTSNSYILQAEVKLYICDVNGTILRTVGKTILNIANYAQNGKCALEIQIEGENTKIHENSIVIFHISLERQDDDSKYIYHNDLDLSTLIQMMILNLNSNISRISKKNIINN